MPPARSIFDRPRLGKPKNPAGDTEIRGSGLRDGDANISTVLAYAQVNIGIKRDFYLPNDPLPMTVCFGVANLLDTVYLIRDGSGIGVFAPQYGPRRGFFLGVSKKNMKERVRRT